MYGSPDVIHSHFLRQSYSVAKIVQKYSNLKFFATIHDTHLNNKIGKHQINQLKLIQNKAIRVFCVSPNLLDNLLIYQIRTTLVNNIIDTDLFNYDKKNDVLNRNRVISAGYLTYRKGMDVLLHAWSKAKIYPEYTLTIMGDGPELDNLVKLANELSIEESVVFYGGFTRHQFAKILLEAKSFVLASRKESFGVVYAEALAAGVPVIGTYCGGPERLINESNGRLVPVDNPNALSSAIVEITFLSSDFNRVEISNEIRENFSANKIANDLIDYYSEAINGNKI